MSSVGKWLLLERKLGLPPDTRWYDPSSKLTGTYKDQPPGGWQELVDLFVSREL